MTPDGTSVPDFLRVEEAAIVVRIGRTAAYELARQFLATEGASGVPVVRIGRQLRVPRHRLEVLAGGPLRWPAVVELVPGPPTTAVASVRTDRRDRSGQPSLPFLA
jgi:hypothetical protein